MCFPTGKDEDSVTIMLYVQYELPCTYTMVQCRRHRGSGGADALQKYVGGGNVPPNKIKLKPLCIFFLRCHYA